MVEGQKRLIQAGSEAKNEIHDEEDANQFAELKIDEAEQENQAMFNELKRLREEKKTKKQENQKILLQKTELESEVCKQQQVHQ